MAFAPAAKAPKPAAAKPAPEPEAAVAPKAMSVGYLVSGLSWVQHLSIGLPDWWKLISKEAGHPICGVFRPCTSPSCPESSTAHDHAKR